MDAPRRTVELSDENADYFGRGWDTLDDAVDDALTRLREREMAEIRAGIEENRKHPERYRPAEEVFAEMRAMLGARRQEKLRSERFGSAMKRATTCATV